MRRTIGLAVVAVMLTGCSVLTGPPGGGEERQSQTSTHLSATPPTRPTTAAPTATSTSNDASKVIASQPMAVAEGLARIDLLSVDRSTADTVLVRFRVANEGAEKLWVYGNLNDTEPKPRYEANGVTLIDGVHNKRYFPLTTSGEACMCSNLDDVAIPPGQAKDLFAIFPAPPPGLRSVTVSVPLTPPFIEVPIGAGPVPPAGLDPAKTQLQPPKILSVTSRAEGEEQSFDEDDTNQKVRLSADVLFALNKADLTARSRTALQSVATRIDASPGDEVTIDGYTDTTGNDAINQPLSERRARAVQNQLKRLVTRSGVTYRSAGHGSQDPVAGNGTEEGRKKNRRVTVTFARPVPPPPSTPPPSPPPAQPPASGAAPAVIATAQPQAADAQNTKLEINWLRRESSGLVALTWTLTNTGSADLYVDFAFYGMFPTDYEGGTTPAVDLFDPANQMYYRPLRDSETHCVCSDFTGVGRKFLQPAESVTLYDVYKLPPEVTTVAINIPGYASPKDVPIS